MGCCQILAVVVFEEAVESQHACEHEEEKEEEEEEREREDIELGSRYWTASREPTYSNLTT
jgi:hypothetical protein